MSDQLRGVTAALCRGAGRHPAGWLLLATAVSVLIGWWQKYPCADGHPAPDVDWTRACYSDVLPLYSGRGLSSGALPYLDARLEYPVLIGLCMALVGLPIHALGAAGRLDGLAHALGFQTVDQGVVFFWATSAINGLLVLATTGMLLALRRDRPRDVLLWSLSPAMMVAFTINWDMLAVAPTVGAMLAWSRRRPGWAGVLIGIGAAAKLFPLVLLLPIVLLCLRRGTGAARRAAALAVAAAAATWLALNLPVALLDLRGWWEPYRFSADRWIDWGSLYYLLDHLSRPLGLHDAVWPAIDDVPTLNRTSLLAFALACSGIAALVRYAPRPPRVAAAAFLAVAAFLLTNKVWSPQFVLWLLPLAVLARPRWTAFLGWQALEVAYLLACLRLLLGGRDEEAMIQAALGRYVAVAVLAGLVVADALHPDRDPLRGPGGTDPDAGVLEPAGALPMTDARLR